MHCRQKVLPVVYCGYTQIRSTATAVKVKARSWDTPPSEPASVPLNPSKRVLPPKNSTLPLTSSPDHVNKWAVRKSQPLKESFANTPAPKTNEWTSPTPLAPYTRSSPSATPPRPSLSKWALSPHTPKSSSGLPSLDTNLNTWDVPSPPAPKLPPSRYTVSPSTNADKWTASQPPPTSKWANPQTSASLSPSSSTSARILPSKRPTNLSQMPPSSALNRWARTAAPAASIQQTRGAPEQGTSQQYHPQQQNGSRPYTPRNDSRLQRDVAPHQAPPEGARHAPYTFDRFAPPSSNPRIAVLQHRQRVKDRAFGTPPDSRRDHDRLSRPRAGGEAQPAEFPKKLPSIGEGTPLEFFAGLENGRSTRGGRPNRDAYKERGSLLSRIHEDVAIPTYSRVSSASQKLDRSRVKKKRNVLEKRVSVDVYIPSTVSVGTLARLLNVRLERLQRQMRLAGMAEEATYDYVLTSDYAVLLAEEFGRNPIVNDEAAFDIYPSPPHANPTTLPSRPPVVTIMGHVDHGKTTLLDTLRSSSVAKGEAGGITQHIGAFSVPVPPASVSADGPRTITFLDTPGHAAFSAMRARGAGVTDIVVLVVAADDGIMPQTREVIELIKKDEGKVGVVVAINKVDKPGTDVDSVQKALMAESIQLEVFGGDVPSVEISGLTGHGLPQLVETLSAMAELQDLRAERDGPVHGYVLESKVHKGLGPVATVLVLRGCLMPGSHIISGVSQAKVRVMHDPTGASVKAAHPGMAITISGWKTLPNAGDEVLQGSEVDIKKAVVNRLRKAEIEASLVDVEAINVNRRQERERRELEAELGEDAKEIDETPVGPKELRLIVKGDVSGSVEAVVGALQGIGNGKAVTKIVSSGVGDVSESDVMMAKAVGGTVVGFSVSTPRAIETLAAQNSVPTCSSSIIYRLMDEIKNRLIALLPVIIEKRVTGEATVLQLFDIQLKAKQTKKVAGCRVVNGIIEKARHARVVRDGVTMHEGSLDTMRHLKKDVVEVRKGLECGLSLSGFGDLREGDLIQMYQKIEKPGVL